MRLTLRTLLAYLDDILDPADARELGKKIEDSEFASGLVHRIRSVTRKLRLGAPKLAGKGMGLDANTVAEYLDNTLPQERAPDFEKVCLESDVQLAEVASCHQILTLVLGEPAEFDAALRERMRSLQRDLEGLPEGERPSRGVPVLAHHASTPEDTPAASPWEDAPEVPPASIAATRSVDSRRSVRLVPILGTLVVTFLLALAALIAIGPFDHDHPILGRFFAEVPHAEGPTSPQVAQAPADAPSAAPEGSAKKAGAGTAAADGGAPSKTAAQRGAKTIEPDARQPADADAEIPPGATDADAAPVPPVPADAAPSDADSPASEEPAPEPKASMAMDDPALVRSKRPADEPEAPEEAAAPEPLALYASDQHVLARYDEEKKTWLRVVTNDPVPTDARLVVPPTYRPQILFSSGVQMGVVGPAELRLTAVDAEGVPGVIVQYGRLLVIPAGQPNGRLNIQFGSRQSRVTFEDQDATLVVDAWRYQPAGDDPQARPANWVLDVFTPAGRLTWQDQGAAAPVVIEANQLVTMLDTSAPSVQPLRQSPPWLDVNSEPRINQLGSRQLEPLLVPDQPLAVALGEQVNNRLVEVRTLAIRSLSQLDEFDPCINGLNSGDLRYFWKDIAESLRTAEARSPEIAGPIQAAFVRLRGEEGMLGERLLWGFSPAQLDAGGAQQLVECLSHPAMDVRVLAYLNLNAITKKTNNFQPEQEPRNQRRSIMSWERDLQRHEIVYKAAPAEPAGLTPPPTEEAPSDGSLHVP